MPKFSVGSVLRSEHWRENTIPFDHNICTVVLLFPVMFWEQPNTFCESFYPGQGVLLVYPPWFPAGVKGLSVNFSFHPLKHISKVGFLINPDAYAD